MSVQLSEPPLSNPCLMRLASYGAFDPEAAEWLQRLCARPRKVSANRPLALEGGSSRNVYAVLDGFACRSSQLEEGGWQIIELILPGDLSDHQPLGGGGSDHAVMTLTPCMVADISIVALQEAIERVPGLAPALAAAARVE